MKLDLRSEFSLEIPLKDGTEEVITGTVRELTKVEQKEIKALFKEDEQKAKTIKKLIKKAERFTDKLEREKSTLTDEELEIRYENQDKLEEEVEAKTNELNDTDLFTKGLKVRFEKTIESAQKDRLKQICDDFGYDKIFQVISKDIEEKKAKK